METVEPVRRLLTPAGVGFASPKAVAVGTDWGVGGLTDEVFWRSSPQGLEITGDKVDGRLSDALLSAYSTRHREHGRKRQLGEGWGNVGNMTF